MSHVPSYDAVVIGSGPNGLAAAITLAQSGKSVIVFEAQESIGGGVRSASLTLPGFNHDLCSAVYPMAITSQFFRSLPLARYGLRWIEPTASLAHPFDDGTVLTIERSVDETARQLGADANAYADLIGPLLENWPKIKDDLLGPLRWPGHPWCMARFGVQAIWSARRFAKRKFRTEIARSLFAGLAAHSMLPLEFYGTTAFALVLSVTAHAVGWPIAQGGAQQLTNALAAHFKTLGGEIISSRPVRGLGTLPPSRVVLCDLTPRQLLALDDALWSTSYQRTLRRYRYGMGAFKMDWALSGPVPWVAPGCRRAAAVHLGPTIEEVASSECSAWEGRTSGKPFVLLAQPSLFDPTRAPPGRHTVWAYCHVPLGSRHDMAQAIELQIERFAPGFRNLIIGRAVASPGNLEARNANLVGGDINGGAPLLRQLFFRPGLRTYRTSLKHVYLCSASTPPGGGVHGMCGFFAARRALKDRF